MTDPNQDAEHPIFPSATDAQKIAAMVGAGPLVDQSPTSDASTAAGAPKARTAALGDIVIVRESGKNDAPGIIAEVFEDTITCNVFRGDHIPHVASHLTQIHPASSGTGWFWRA